MGAPMCLRTSRTRTKERHDHRPVSVNHSNSEKKKQWLKAFCKLPRSTTTLPTPSTLTSNLYLSVNSNNHPLPSTLMMGHAVLFESSGPGNWFEWEFLTKTSETAWVLDQEEGPKAMTRKGGNRQGSGSGVGWQLVTKRQSGEIQRWC